jgi:tetratricopeptide (TPR) repeat protein
MSAPSANPLAQAVGLFGMGQLEPAAQACASLIRRQPGIADPHYLLGLIRDSQGRGDEAAASFQRFVRLKRASGFEDHRNLGIALARLKRVEAAAASFEKALTIRPEAHTYSLLGDTLRQLGRHESAMDCFRKALALDAGTAVAHVGLGVLHMARGDQSRPLPASRLP